ncbi:DEAD/DEAH box helicase family protein [Chryseobacterium sp. ES2]|uniref:DEAD/DEAH box helicase family protein n=1 Tax=Chryseobacterium metallicongregator TaxID=3073042 RepID=A0ABU1E480_9FLAO|nr:DEAD/DEAH box helicase family protein [Chryseobacterium sp. ES2]MDR4952613.1 DEAD/DEAH box helicase family protein [Chryseobacterium sp. ES2]
MAGKKIFNTQDLVLKVNDKNFDPIKFPLDDWERFLNILCGNRHYQKEAIKTAIHYLISTKYQTIDDLVKENYKLNDQLKLRYKTEQEYLNKIQIPHKLSACLDLATGTGKSFVMYGIAQIALGLGIIDKVLVLGPPSLTIEKELTKKFEELSANINLINSIPDSSVKRNPSIINANQTITDGVICIENINAVYSRTGSSIFDSLAFGMGQRCLVLNDEVHHAYNKSEGRTTENISIKKWKEFLLDNSCQFRYILGFTGTSYIDNEYFNDVIYRYSLRSAIEHRFVKSVNYIIENEDSNENEKFQKILHNHKYNKALYSNIKPLTILITKDIKIAKQLKTRLVEFLAEKGEGSEEYLSNEKVLLVTSDREHRHNVLKLPYVDNRDEPVEWIISVAMLTEGWDVKNVFQIVPMEEKAFNSKLLIAQVLGRGLRIPNNYPNAEVTIFNHYKWSERIKDLVEEILEMETKIKNSSITQGDRSSFNFTIYNLDYTKEKKEVQIEKNTEIFNYRDHINFVSETFEHITETKYVKFGDKEYKISYPIEKERFSINDIANKIHDEFQIRKLEGIILKMDESEYSNDNLPNKDIIEKLIRNSMQKVGMTGDYLGKKNRQAIFSSFNTLLRKKPKSIILSKVPNSIIEIRTESKEHENISVLGLKNDSTIFYSDDYQNEIVIPDSLIAFEEIKEDLSLPRSAFSDSLNKFLFKTPIDLVFTSREPERKFINELVKKDNASQICAWIKSNNHSFYSLEYSYTLGSHTSTHFFNPDFFILLRKDDFDYVSVIEVKADNDNSDENKAKNKYAIEHFNELNKQLEEKKVRQKYFFNFLSPSNYSDYFTYLKDGRLLDGNYTSNLDTELLK